RRRPVRDRYAAIKAARVGFANLFSDKVGASSVLTTVNRAHRPRRTSHCLQCLGLVRSAFAEATADSLRVACQPKLTLVASVSEGWCGRGDSNPYDLATASPSRRYI